MRAGTIGDRRGAGKRLGQGWGGTWGTGEQVACRHLGDKRTGAEIWPAEPWKDGGAEMEKEVVRMAELQM